MGLNIIFFLSSDTSFFEEFFIKKNLDFFFLDYNSFIFLNELNVVPQDSTKAELTTNDAVIYSFIDQADESKFFTNLENVQTIYHYSIPTTKLFYPEPFIASASFMHSDLWFVHILVYQYWLWFVFVFIVVFFFYYLSLHRPLMQYASSTSSRNPWS